MHRCSHPEHPHCTVWVMPGEPACAHGHIQPPAAMEAAPAPVPDAATPPSASPVPASDSGVPSAGAAAPSVFLAPQRPHIRVSGFDPRAAGGRQVLKLELRGMPSDCAPRMGMRASSRLRLDGGERHSFTRTGRGEWLPVFLEFSSRGLEHGQYRIVLELHSGTDDAAGARTWIATLLILAPRLDASLHEIHQTFLATHKNVRVSADDASIARVKASVGGGGSVDIDVKASNAGIAHLDLDGGGGKIDLGFSSIAWDEDLLEIDQPLIEPTRQPTVEPTLQPTLQPILQSALQPPGQPIQAVRHPCPASTACLVFAATGSGAPATGAVRARHPTLPGLAHPVRHLRLFALDEYVLGRDEPDALDADLLLAHHLDTGPCRTGLTRRISARHALIRRGRDGFEIEDVSRFGLLVDGAWPGKHAPVTLRTGMRIELTASIPGVAVLEVGAVLANGIVLFRADAGRAHEAFWLLDPERDVSKSGHSGRTHASGPPLLFHSNGGFWYRDRAGGDAVPLTPTSGSEWLASWPHGLQFTARPYPEAQGATIAACSAKRLRAPSP